jgi:hypothetical protein
VATETVNGLRNKVAHDLEFEIREAQQSSVTKAIPRRMREAMTVSNVSGDAFQNALVAIVMQLDVARGKLSAEREIMAKAMLYMRHTVRVMEGRRRSDL